MEMGQAILWGKDLPRVYWSEAINAAIHILNQMKMEAVDDKAPYNNVFRILGLFFVLDFFLNMIR